MFVIGNVAVEDSVRGTAFACDLNACKGACCCIEGGRGAPLSDEETVHIQKALPAAAHYLSEHSLQVLKQDGAYNGIPGDFATTCIDNRECVFVVFETGIAHCAFEKAFDEGKTEWRKPLSCHLFPIRIDRGEREVVRYERISECYAGRQRGERERIPLSEFLRIPLIRKYGDAWYAELIKKINNW